MKSLLGLLLLNCLVAAPGNAFLTSSTNVKLLFIYLKSRQARCDKNRYCCFFQAHLKACACRRSMRFIKMCGTNAKSEELNDELSVQSQISAWLPPVYIKTQQETSKLLPNSFVQSGTSAVSPHRKFLLSEHHDPPTTVSLIAAASQWFIWNNASLKKTRWVVDGATDGHSQTSSLHEKLNSTSVMQLEFVLIWMCHLKGWAFQLQRFNHFFFI